MNHKKRVFALLMSGILAISMTACGQDDNTSSNDNSTINSSSVESFVTSETDESSEPVKEIPLELNHTYTTQFSDVNMITYPRFEFDYPDNWQVSHEEITTDREIVTLSNERGVKVTYTQFSFPKDFNFGGNSVSMLRLDVSKVADSQFVPKYVQATDHSGLGAFMVAKLKVTGQLEMKTDTDYTDVDGAVSYVVLPESRVGTAEDVRGLFEAEFSFWYSSHLSVIASAPDGQFTEAEEKEVLAILSSFRNEKMPA